LIQQLALRSNLISAPMRILLAEDDRQLREAIARGLREASYAVDDAPDGGRALFLAAVNDYDAIILDVVLPVRDGLDVCREIRRKGSHAPILMLTARDTVDDKITGLDAGADDYLTKPFDFGELLARLRALVRRRGEVLPAELSVADLVVDTRRHTARRGRREITLTSKEFALLEHLVRNAGRIVTRAEINAHVWDDNHDPFSNLIDVYVSRLRRKIDGGERAALIATRRGVGYMIAAPAVQPPPAAATRGATD
jgi:two-component system copper resistance phosphate regulon response regulator CusR